jgi:hypothetical protein
MTAITYNKKSAPLVYRPAERNFRTQNLFSIIALSMLAALVAAVLLTSPFVDMWHSDVSPNSSKSSHRTILQNDLANIALGGLM